MKNYHFNSFQARACLARIDKLLQNHYRIVSLKRIVLPTKRVFYSVTAKRSLFRS